MFLRLDYRSSHLCRHSHDPGHLAELIGSGDPVHRMGDSLGKWIYRIIKREVLRDELLNREIFANLAEVQILIGAWRKEYNQVRPHS